MGLDEGELTDRIAELSVTNGGCSGFIQPGDPFISFRFGSVDEATHQLMGRLTVFGSEDSEDRLCFHTQVLCRWAMGYSRGNHAARESPVTQNPQP
jgi:hypothetical protein